MIGIRRVLADHYRLLRDEFSAAGAEVRSQGDSLFYAFPDAPSAVRAALAGQLALAAAPVARGRDDPGPDGYSYRARPGGRQRLRRS